MHRSARQAAILRNLDLHGSCIVTGLATQFAVSDETIRRDIKVLANKGKMTAEQAQAQPSRNGRRRRR